MSDLISRSELLKEVEKYKFGAISNDAEREYIKSTILDFIIGQPTVYDIDKVVEELEKIRARETCDKEKCDTKELCRICVVDDAIEIVKQGGASDNVCEWKYTKEIMDNTEFKIGCNQNALKRGIVPNNFSYHDFKYCPYCGKKIKVVE